MKLKYYLRGLGIGIIITTLILTVVLSGGKEKLSDEEIIQRAEALGMVMVDTEETEQNDEMVDDTEAATEEQTAKETEPVSLVDTETSVEEEQTTEQNVEGVLESEEVPDAEENIPAKPENAEQTTTVPQASAEVSFTVSAGESSDTVAFNLYKAGIIDDATAFNSYMVKNGYDSRLRTGTFQIKTGSTYDEVLKILAP